VIVGARTVGAPRCFCGSVRLVRVKGGYQCLPSLHLTQLDEDQGQLARVPQCRGCLRAKPDAELNEQLRCPECQEEKETHLTKMAERPEPPSSGLGQYQPPANAYNRRVHEVWHDRAMQSAPSPHR
jgi:hypothetical protein